jgi:hypothetical protein
MNPRGGPGLAAGCLFGFLGLSGLVIAAVIGPQIVSGAAIAVLGVLLISVRRPLGELRVGSPDLPALREASAIVAGLLVTGAGVIRLIAGIR